MRRTHVLFTLVILNGFGLVFLSGCETVTHAENKQAAVARWTAARTGILYSLAVEQFETGQLDTAYRSCTQGIGTAPDNPMFYELAGRVMIERGELERAFQYLDRSSELEPKRDRPYYLLGVVYQRWRQYEKAHDAYMKAYQCKMDDVSGLLAASEMLVKLNKPEQAISQLQAKLIYFEHNAAVRLTIARIYMMQKKYDQAVSMYREASLLSPDDLMISEQLAIAEYGAGNHMDAIYHLTRVLSDETYKDRSDLKLTLADCYMATNKPLEAGRYYMQLTRDNPDDIPAWIRLGQAAYMANEQSVLQRAADRVLVLAPKRSEGYLLKGMAAQLRGDSATAAAQYSLASQVAPTEALPWMLKGMSLENQNQIKQAQKAYAMAATLAPKDQRARKLLSGVTPGNE